MKQFFIAFVIIICLFTVPAMAQVVVFDSIMSGIEIPDTYTIVDEHSVLTLTDWLAEKELDSETVINDFIERGVLLQAWSPEGDICLEITATTNDSIYAVFDLNEQTSTYRGEYRRGHYPDNIYENLGYTFSSASWNTTDQGRFLVANYVFKENSSILHRGFIRRTIRNGYEITLDLQVHGRNSTTKDNNTLNSIWKTFRFVELLPLPPAASAKIQITNAPPLETNHETFKLEGTAAHGVQLAITIMGMGEKEPIIMQEAVNKTEKFSIPITLNTQGVYLISVTGTFQNEIVTELFYPLTFQRTLLTVIFSKQPKDVVTTDDTIFTGTAEKSAEIQIFVNGQQAQSKRVTGAGKFSITIPTEEEGLYEVVLIFSKRGLADRRYTYSFVREWDAEDTINYLKKQAVKPSYTNLVDKIEGYTGKTMMYNLYMLGTEESGNQFISQMAFRKNNDAYHDIVLVVSQENPNITPGEKVTMFGTCIGMATGNAPDNSISASYPSFDLLTFASIE